MQNLWRKLGIFMIVCGIWRGMDKKQISKWHNLPKNHANVAQKSSLLVSYVYRITSAIVRLRTKSRHTGLRYSKIQVCAYSRILWMWKSVLCNSCKPSGRISFVLFPIIYQKRCVIFHENCWVADDTSSVTTDILLVSKVKRPAPFMSHCVKYAWTHSLINS